MTTKCTFICGLHNIQVEGDLGDGVILIPNDNNYEMPKIGLTNNKEKIQSLLHELFPQFVGRIEYNHLINGYPIVAFAESEFDFDEINSIQYLDLHLFVLKMYFFCLWLTKDNAADFDIGFLQFINKKGELEVSSNNLTSTNFDVGGNRNSIVFNLDNLNTAKEYLKNSIQIEHKNRPKIASASSLDRVSIANYFIQSAIAANDLGLKAVGYCSALETLFSNGDNTELAHKLSERVAKFLEIEIEPRKEIYRTVKKVYEMRSKVVHGATFKSKKTDEFSGLIKKTDDICRRVMIYAITTSEDSNIFDMPKDSLDNFFLNLALS